ncbi:dTMP kinase [Streptococcus sanguinis]|uniref:dTMP kinase n=1 Tax=Streptococcus sanguinis TaxID=1305 RepID=UPI000F690ADF|nr:dTMP kinase [Streptococcus sanguinis]RSI12880.1 Thymidylate kinase [Streptococcus sanguinis]
MKNILIAFEGLDGSGKTTQIKKLNSWFIDNEIEVFITKQPTDFYRNDKRVRDYLDFGIAPNMYSIALLAAADRTFQLSTEINPKLSNNINVICDRYIYSSLAFFKARGIDYDEILHINKDFTVPDLVIFLDIPPTKALVRVERRDKGNLKFEEKDSKIFDNVRNNFLEILPEDALIIDSTQDVDTIFEIIVKKVEKIMKGE